MNIIDFVEFLFLGEVRTKVERLLHAAEHGSAKAQLKLGVCYLSGRGVEPNAATAVHWIQMAAAQNHPQAQFYMGRARFSGDGIPKEYESAYAWFQLASEAGHRNAMEWRELLQREMTADEVAEALRFAEDLRERICGERSRTMARPLHKRILSVLNRREA
ncbi:MAG: tetratricopeptide repeat protein [Kiritimatiellales bacterium]